MFIKGLVQSISILAFSWLKKILYNNLFIYYIYIYIYIYILWQQLGLKIIDTSLVLMKVYIFIRTRVQRKKYTFSNYTFSNMKTLFALLVTHKEKRQYRMPINLKNTEFAPASVRTFHPKATGAGGKAQSKKLHRLKCKLLHLQYIYIYIYIYTYILELHGYYRIL